MNRHTYTRLAPLRAAFILALLLVMPGSGFAADPGTLHIRFMQGEAEIHAGDTGETIAAEANAPLLEGDKLWLAQGARVELMSREGTLVRLDEESFLAVEGAGEGSSRFHLDVGRLHVNSGDGRKPVSCTTPTVSVRTTGPAVFALDVSDRGSTLLSVFEGNLFVEWPGGNLIVGSGKRAAFDGQSGGPEFFALAPLDRWEAWNRDRDRQWALAGSDGRTQEYLPAELAPYAGDLASTGEWVYAAPYGYIWRPFVAQAWAPYRLGYWRWVRGHHVWISYEPWGWVPYHYGRWVQLTAGWCWVPPRRGFVQWGAGYVGWVRTPTHIAWVPLAPHEQYRRPDFQHLPLLHGSGNDGRGAKGYGYYHLSAGNTRDALTSAPQVHAAAQTHGNSNSQARPPRTIVPVGIRKPTAATASYAPRQEARPGARPSGNATGIAPQQNAQPPAVTEIKAPSPAAAAPARRPDRRSPDPARNERPMLIQTPPALPAVQSHGAPQGQPARPPVHAAAEPSRVEPTIQARPAPAARPRADEARDSDPERPARRPDPPEKAPVTQKEPLPSERAPGLAPERPAPAQTRATPNARDPFDEPGRARQAAPRLSEGKELPPTAKPEAKSGPVFERRVGPSSFSPARKGF